MTILFDIVLLLILAKYAKKGNLNGLIPTFGMFVGAGIALFVSYEWSGEITDLVGIVFLSAWVNLVAFMAIFIATQRALGFVLDLIDRRFKKLTNHKSVYYADKILGTLFGCCEGLVLVGGYIFFIKAYNVHPVLVEWINGSMVASVIEPLMRQILALV